MFTAHAEQYGADGEQEHIAGKHDGYAEDQAFCAIHCHNQGLSHKYNVAVNAAAGKKPQLLRFHFEHFTNDEEYCRADTADEVRCAAGYKEPVENFAGIFPLQEHDHVAWYCYARQHDGKPLGIIKGQYLFLLQDYADDH